MSNEQLMRLALDDAASAAVLGEVPVGCVIFHKPTDAVIGRGANRRETENDPTAHAELIAIRQAAISLASWRLIDCTLVVTLEPCPMCAGAIVNARVPRLVYGCADPKAGAVETLFRLCDDPRLNHRVDITAGILAEPCGQLLREFFRTRRKAVK